MSLKKEFLSTFVFTFSLSILMVILSAGFAFSQNSDVIISGDNSFVNEIGNLHVVGEVENNSPKYGPLRPFWIQDAIPE